MYLYNNCDHNNHRQFDVNSRHSIKDSRPYFHRRVTERASSPSLSRRHPLLVDGTTHDSSLGYSQRHHGNCIHPPPPLLSPFTTPTASRRVSHTQTIARKSYPQRHNYDYNSGISQHHRHHRHCQNYDSTMTNDTTVYDHSHAVESFFVSLILYRRRVWLFLILY